MEESDNIVYQSVLKRMVKYCSYQERCLEEVNIKLDGFDLASDERQAVIDYLVTNLYLDQERYVRAVVRGKFVHNSWGRIKIENMLMAKDVSPYLFEKAWVEEISQVAYLECIRLLLEKKLRSTSASCNDQLKKKVLLSLYQKGFEIELVEPLLDDILYKGV